jgi:hypothetical protein
VPSQYNAPRPVFQLLSYFLAPAIYGVTILVFPVVFNLNTVSGIF